METYTLQLRHMKLLHPHVAIISSPSISPETRDQDQVISSSTASNQHSSTSDGSNGEAAR